MFNSERDFFLLGNENQIRASYTSVVGGEWMGHFLLRNSIRWAYFSAKKYFYAYLLFKKVNKNR